MCDFKKCFAPILEILRQARNRVKGRRSLPAHRTVDAVRSLPYSVQSARSALRQMLSCWRREPFLIFRLKVVFVQPNISVTCIHVACSCANLDEQN